MTVTIGRRELLAALGGAAVAWPLAARARQQPKMLRVGFVGIQSREAPVYTNFLKRMAELGIKKAATSHSTTSKHRISKATKRTIASSRRARLMCSWRSGTSGRCVLRSRLRTVSRSRFWPSISTLWRRDMWRICRVPEATSRAYSYGSSSLPRNGSRSLARRSRARLSLESHLIGFARATRCSNRGGPQTGA